MKLFFAPGTCSLSPHIVLRELGLPHQLVRVDNKTKKTADGGDFLSINPKGYVAALQLDNGEVLTEGAAIVQYLADLRPEAGLAPANGSWQRARLQEWLSFIGGEIHALCSPLFNQTLAESARVVFKDKLARRLGHAAAALERHDYLMGARFGVADAYLFSVLRWLPLFGIGIGDWPALARYVERVGARASVQAALAAEAEA